MTDALGVLKGLSESMEDKARELNARAHMLQIGVNWTSQESKIKEAQDAVTEAQDYMASLQKVYEAMAFLLPLIVRSGFKNECQAKLNRLWEGL